MNCPLGRTRSPWRAWNVWKIINSSGFWVGLAFAILSPVVWGFSFLSLGGTGSPGKFPSFSSLGRALRLHRGPRSFFLPLPLWEGLAPQLSLAPGGLNPSLDCTGSPPRSQLLPHSPYLNPPYRNPSSTAAYQIPTVTRRKKPEAGQQSPELRCQKCLLTSSPQGASFPLPGPLRSFCSPQRARTTRPSPPAPPLPPGSQRLPRKSRQARLRTPPCKPQLLLP